MLGKILFSYNLLFKQLGEDFVSTKEWTKVQMILNWDEKIF